MGNEVPPPLRPVSTTTSVRVEIELFLEARRRQMNLSAIMNAALRSLLKKDEEDMTEQQISELLKERRAKVGKSLEAHAQEAALTVEAALMELQPRWNVYLAAAPGADHAAKLAWVEGKREHMPALRALDAEMVLKELEG
jgi:post-segregation antitoxin (ccd killing protein)